MKQFLLSVILFALMTTGAHAQNHFNFGDETYYSSGLGLGLMGGALIAMQRKPGLDESKLQQLDAANIYWSVDRKVAGNWNPTYGKVSDYMLSTATLLPFAYAYSQSGSGNVLSLMYLESFLLTVSGTYLAKYSVDRYRPFTYNTDKSMAHDHATESNMSFFSGHTSTVANSLFFMASSCSVMYKNNPWCTAAWSTAVLGTASMAYLRVTAGWHFPSDVLLGALWGGLVGYAIPQIHRSDSKSLGQVKLKLKLSPAATPLLALQYHW